LSGYTVCYVGHSMGGAVGVLRASRDQRIKFLVSLAVYGPHEGFRATRIRNG